MKKKKRDRGREREKNCQTYSSKHYLHNWLMIILFYVEVPFRKSFVLFPCFLRNFFRLKSCLDPGFHFFIQFLRRTRKNNPLIDYLVALTIMQDISHQLYHKKKSKLIFAFLKQLSYKPVFFFFFPFLLETFWRTQVLN